MSKRARYVGPYDKVTVHWPPGETAFTSQQTWEVENNKWLPDDVPVKLRDELLAGPDWSEIDQDKGSDK